jgi:ATP-dependent Lon protease
MHRTQATPAEEPFMDPCIPLAELQSIYSVADVDKALEDGAAKRNTGLKSWYDRMRELGGSRYIIKPSTVAAVDELYEASPNFTEVIDDLRKFLALAVAGNEAVQFTPMLLLGEPGLGKTYFAKKLAHALATGFEFISMSSLTAGWVLTGASSQWHNARPGKVAHTLIEGDYANPVVVLDEVDKAGGDSRYDPMGALYTLLERDTAVHFKDVFIDVGMDASHILWVATANDESTIPEPILNRMNVYAIDRPDAEGARRIALAVYHDILDAHTWPFPAEPSDAVLDRLAGIAPRDMRKLLLDAFGNARLAGRDHLVPEDIDARKLCGRRTRVGF